MGNISSVLKAKRKELGLTLAQIAEKIGVTFRVREYSE